jgi:hypothetical protein
VRVIGPRGVVEVDTGVGVDVSLMAMSSSVLDTKERSTRRETIKMFKIQ